MKLYALMIFFLLIPLVIWGQAKYSVSGYVKDTATGEDLIGATILVEKNKNQGGVTNAYGFYSLLLPEGDYELIFSYVGYDTKSISLSLQKDTRLNVELSDEVIGLAEVVVTAREEDDNVKSTAMGTVGLPMAQV
ncbi:MAG TPA: carboxypeptidase-like regulatory domain-containing protein, partial [Saprospiraceae bacterium]|nr:carboxypeptidase-like regulatory domain-containing protein [Saprospiraceae bacterium]